MKTIKDQPLFSTLEDSQGEKRDKSFLQEIVDRMPPRYPLGQHHDMGLASKGYIENFRLVQIPGQRSEWNVIGDVFLNDDEKFEELGGFSYSKTEIAIAADGVSEGAIYVTFPLYRDKNILAEILSYERGLSAGKWIKKSRDPATINLIVTFVVFVASPIWKKVFDEKVWPFLEKIVAKYRCGSLRERPFDYGAVARDDHGRTVNIYFVPDRTRCYDTFTKELVSDGLAKVMMFLNSDRKARDTGVSLVRLYYRGKDDGYRLFTVQYLDGEELHFG